MAIDIKNSTATQAVLQLAIQNQSKLKATSIQIATSNKYDDFKGFAGDGAVEKLLSFKSTLSSSDNFISSNNIIVSRLDTMNQTVEQLQDIASELSQLIALRRNSASGSITALAVQAESLLDNVAGKLNIKFDGRYLFAGTKTNTKPLQDIHTSNLGTANAATASYYSGDNNKPTVKISGSQELEYGITGNEEAFQQLIAAAHLAINGDTQDDDDILAQAVDMINDATFNLTSVRATIISKKDIIVQANLVHSDVGLLVGENLVKISQTNIVDATTRMSELEAVIQASFIAFNRLNGLRLSNFLN